jgi:hypothetical protein
VDGLDRITDRFPAKRIGDFRSHIEIDPGNDEITTWIDQSCDVAKAAFGLGRLHMAQKVIGHHDVLVPQDVDYLWIAGISSAPCDPFLDP